MEEKNESSRRERRKKSDGRSNENQQIIVNEDNRSSSKGRERPIRSEEPIRREVIQEQRGSDSSSNVRSSRESSGSRSNRGDETSSSNQIRPSSSQRGSREDIPVRPSSSQRRNDSLGGESKERVVRDTVSFTKSDAPISRQSPSTIPNQPVYTSKTKAPEPDDYDDDFEAYDDDFEDDEDSKPTPKGSSNQPNPSSIPKLSMAASSRADAEMKILRQSVEQENSQAMERRQNIRKEDDDKKASPSLSPQYKDSISSNTNNSSSSVNTNSQVQQQQQQQQPGQLKKKKTTGLMGFSNVSNMTQGPRMKRLQQLRASGVLEMQDEKSVVLNIIPSSQYEVYHRQVFSQNPQIRQMGVPFDISRRDMEVATDEIVMNDKEMQFVYGDDTGLINAMNRVAFRKMAKKLNLTTGSKDTDSEMWSQPVKTNNSVTIGIGAENDNLENKGKDDIINENRLNLFLQAAAQLCEDIMDEEGARGEHKSQSAKDRSTLPKSLFSSSDWISLGGDVSEGANELVRGRTVSAVSFSSLQPHLLLTSHPYNESDDTDLRPFKGIYCVWSLSAPGAPSVVLEGSGQPTCCCFSATQTYVIIGGTSEGTLHMWDLRETNSLHANRDTIDLRIAKGLRKPCYSTQTLTISNSIEYAAYASTLRSSEMSDVEWDQHACPLVQIEPVSSSTSISSFDLSSTSQFISLDSSGKAIIWVASQASGTNSSLDHGVDYGLSPWGKMRLIRQRVLYGVTSNPLDSLNLGRDLLPRSKPSLGVIPGDTSMFLLSYDSGGHGGTVKKVVRYDTTNNSNQLKNSKQSNNNYNSSDTLIRSNKSYIVVNLDGRDDSKEDEPMGIFSSSTLSTFTPLVTAISVSSHSISLSSDSKNNSPLVLVGRSDGSLDIFVLESGEILTTWNDLTLFQTKSRQHDDYTTDLFQTSAIVYVTWVPWKSIASFIVVDSCGYLYYFDLTRDSSKPIYVEDLSISSLLPNLVHLSSCRSVGGTVHIAVGDYDGIVSNGGIKIKKISDDLIWMSSINNNNNNNVKISSNNETKSEGKDNDYNHDNDEKLSSTIKTTSVPCLSSQQSSWIGRVTGTNVVMEYRGGNSNMTDGKTRK